MKTDYPNKMSKGGKNKRRRKDHDSTGKTCGTCVHAKRCLEKFGFEADHIACLNYVQLGGE